MIIVISGPTCLGKTESAIKVARHFNAEIINGDAFQCYKEMNIGVAKPSKEELSKATHHLFSFVDVDHPYSIMEYQRNLREKVDELLAHGKNVVIVGGSGLYIRSALYDYEFKDEEPFDTSVFDKLSSQELHEKLKEIDPKEAEKIHPNNRKRIIRALSIYMSQNVTKSEIISEQKHLPIYQDVRFFVRDLPREELYERINIRVDKMMEQGLLDEAKTLYEKYGETPTALQAIGYKELIEYFFSIITNEWICIHFFCTFALLLLNTNVKEIICTQQKDNYTSLTATADLFASMVRWQTGMD